MPPVCILFGNSPLQDAEEWKSAGIDAFIVVFSVTDRQSFQKAVDLLYSIRNAQGSADLAVILVANKTDLMRSRVVAEQGEVTVLFWRVLNLGFKVQNMLQATQSI